MGQIKGEDHEDVTTAFQVFINYYFLKLNNDDV